MGDLSGKGSRIKEWHEMNVLLPKVLLKKQLRMLMVLPLTIAVDASSL
jgi:hypothetical protein